MDTGIEEVSEEGESGVVDLVADVGMSMDDGHLA